MPTASNSVNEPLVSVVVPLYNHDRFIHSCLESIRRETYPYVELLILDDGSSDGSYELARQWLRAHAKEFVATGLERQNNQGITKTLNRLIDCANGDFIFPLGSDDEVAHAGISQLVDHYQRNASGPTLLLSDAELMDLTGSLLSASACQYFGRDPRVLARSSLFRDLSVLTAWGAPFGFHFYPKLLWEEFGRYDEELKYEDLFFALKGISHDCLAFAPLASRRYRFRVDNSITPGLSERDYAPWKPRSKVAPELMLAYRFFLLLANFRDRNEGRFAGRVVNKLLYLLRLAIKSGSLLADKASSPTRMSNG